MNEDIKLKRSCIIISIVAFTILIIAVILKFSVFSNLPNKARNRFFYSLYYTRDFNMGFFWNWCKCNNFGAFKEIRLRK